MQPFHRQHMFTPKNMCLSAQKHPKSNPNPLPLTLIEPNITQPNQPSLN